MSNASATSIRCGTLILASTTLVLLALWPSGVSLVNFWLRIEDYQFGLAVAAVCMAWLGRIAWQMRRQEIRPVPWAIPWLVVALVAWAISYVAVSELLQQLLLPIVLWLTIFSSAGAAAGRASAQPIAILYLGLPWWDILVPALQTATVVVTEGLLRLGNIPANVQATTITIPEGSFEVAEGCAGKHYFTIAVTLGVLVGAFCRLPRGRRAVLIVAAAIFALVTNWVRVIVIVVAGHVSNMTHYLVAKEHLSFGTYLFILPVMAIALLARRLSKQVLPGAAATVSGVSTPQTLTLPQRFAVLASLASLVIPVAAILSGYTSGVVRLTGLPVLASEWQGPLPPNPIWRPRFLGAADEVRAAYRSADGEIIEVYIVVYGPQSADHELVSYNNSLLAPGTWRLESESKTDGLTLQSAVRESDRWVIASTYKIGGFRANARGAAQIGYGAMEMFGAPASGIVSIATRCAESCNQSNRLLEAFWQRHGRQLVSSVPSSYSEGNQ